MYFLNIPEPEVEIVDRRPSAKHNPGTNSGHENFSLKKFFRAVSKRSFGDGRLFRFFILLIIFVGIFDVSWLTGYVIAAAVYGWKFLDDSVIYLRHYIPKKLFLMLTFKSAFYYLLLVLVARFVLGILIGWLVMPILLLLSFYRRIVLTK